MTIRRLPEDVVVRIAAGEVIERPASVVKELVENSLDAGARRIVVSVEGGGLKRIEVSDDGCGIPREEMPLAVVRHATSKLFSGDDLQRIGTLGFRGEALATIAVVGRLTLTSRVSNGEAARLPLDASSEADLDPRRIAEKLEPAARDVGTTVEVTDLFLKTPARLKFIKSERAEFARIAEIIERLAPAHPEVSFELIRDGKRFFFTSGNGRLRDVAVAVLGADAAREMADVEAKEGSYRIKGLIGPTHLTRRNRTGFSYHLSGRPISDPTIAHAIAAGYEGVLPPGRFPVVFLGLFVPAEEVDVNVHPTKAQVRFRDPRALHRFVSRSLRTRLRGDLRLPSPTIVLKSDKATSLPQEERMTQKTIWAAFRKEKASSPAAVPAREEPERCENDERGRESGRDEAGFSSEKEMLERAAARLEYRGEVGGRYLLAEDGEGLVIVDQHAAHERVLYDALMEQCQNGETEVAPLIVPVTVEATPAEIAVVEEMRETLAELGFEIEVWPGSICVRTVPALLSVSSATRIFREVLSELREGGEVREEMVPHARIARMACRAAVKGRSRLEPEEAREILRLLARATDPYNCPHGRPTMVRISIAELDKRFERT